MLNFDSWQRCETVKYILDWCLPKPGAKLLDVGGYPGRMRHLLPHHDWVICDPLVDSPGEQVKGSADALPFKDNAFDLAVSIDVLEHIAPDKRTDILDEITRVSKHGMILTFPYDSDPVRNAEEKIRTAYKRLFKKEHPWLSEHKQFPLPSLQKILAHLDKKGGQIAALNVGSLHHWVYLQLMDLILESLPGGLDLAKDIDAFYQTKLFPHDFNLPTYRKVIIHLLHVEEPITLDFVTTPREEEILVEMELQEKFTHGLLHIFDEQEKEKEALEEEQQHSTLSGDYLSRLEETQRLWETSYKDTLNELQQSYAWRNNLEQRRSFRVYKRLMHMLGRKVNF
jgi:SAM-dependent methyltransferase